MITNHSVPDELQKILKEAQRAPSVHNVQPVQVEVLTDQRLLLSERSSTRLKVSDPSGHDQLVSFGCYIEGLSLALSKMNRSIEVQTISLNPIQFEIKIKNSSALDELANYIDLRKSYRGLFNPIDEEKRKTIEDGLAPSPNIHLIGDRGEIDHWASVYDFHNHKLYQDQNFITELYSWLRLATKHPKYDVDGLNAEALSLSSFEAKMGDILLNPKVFRLIKPTPLAKLLSEEGSKIRSSWWIVLISGPKNLSAMEKGREFYRSWLELTKHSVFGCPLSVLVDNYETKSELEKLIPKDHQLINVLRAGMVRPTNLYQSPRIKIQDLIKVTSKIQ